MGAEPGRRSLKMPAEKLGPVIVVSVECLSLYHAGMSQFISRAMRRHPHVTLNALWCE